MAEVQALPMARPAVVSSAPQDVPNAVRKKFATPPVKIACLAWDRPCQYKPSRRGGPRVRKRPRPSEDDVTPSVESKPADVDMPSNLLVENYINPGAGLKNISEVINDSDTLFDTLFSNTTNFTGNITPPLSEVAILALIPSAQDSNPLAEESILFRRKYAHFLAQSAFETIETESENPQSSVEPSRALEDSDDEYNRQPFHPSLPLELESVVAFDILSVYEYAQRGNLKRMRSRANAALISAMGMSLHTCHEEDTFSEAKRRVWWMTYVCVCQASIVSNMKPSFDIFTPSFTTKMPTTAADAEHASQRCFCTLEQFCLGLFAFTFDALIAFGWRTISPTQTMYSTWSMESGSLANDLLSRLQQGILSILGTLENYGTAFEALGGMRDQIRDKAYSSITFDT
ncbi:hypothetical protein KJ359_012270 [Pestalotiopsis sp. 9143b]|nr:hypothetical protein KJ359_012270 [Pestalotiopsis sp. 9143b]